MAIIRDVFTQELYKRGLVDETGAPAGTSTTLGPFASVAEMNGNPGAIAALASGKPASAQVTDVGLFDVVGGAWVQRPMLSSTPSALRAALLGNSLTALELCASTTDGPVYGDPAAQQQAQYSARGAFNWMNALLGQPFQLVYAGGVSGETSTQILARINDVIGASPDWVFLCATARNDVTLLSSVYGGDVALCYATSIANTTKIWDMLLARGVRVVDRSISPKTPAAGEAGNQKYLVTRLNRALRAEALKRDGVIWVDAYSALVDPSDVGGHAVASRYFDTTHWATAGAFLQGRDMAAQVRPFIRPDKSLVSSQTDCYQSDPLNPNILRALDGLFLSTTGASAGTGVTGTQLTAMTIARSAGTGLTATASVAAAPVFTDSLLTDAAGSIGNAQVLDITAAAAGDQIKATLPSTVTFGQFPAGSKCYGESLVKIENATNLISVSCEVSITYAGGSPASPSVSRTLHPVSLTLEGSKSASYEAHLRTPVVQLPANATGLTAVAINWYSQFSGAGGAKVSICRASIVKV